MDSPAGGGSILAHGGRDHHRLRRPVGDDAVVWPCSGLGVAYPAPGATVVGDPVTLVAPSFASASPRPRRLLGARARSQDVPAGKLTIGVPARVVGTAPVQA